MNEKLTVDKVIAVIPLAMILGFVFLGGYVAVLVLSLLLFYLVKKQPQENIADRAQLREVAYAMICYSLYAIVPNLLIATWIASQPESLMTESLMITGIYWLWSVLFMNLAMCLWSAASIFMYQKFWKFPLVIRFDEFPHKQADVDKLNVK